MDLVERLARLIAKRRMLSGRAFDWPAPALKEFSEGKPVRAALYDEFVSTKCVERWADRKRAQA